MFYTAKELHELLIRMKYLYANGVISLLSNCKSASRTWMEGGPLSVSRNCFQIYEGTATICNVNDFGRWSHDDEDIEMEWDRIESLPSSEVIVNPSSIEDHYYDEHRSPHRSGS